MHERNPLANIHEQIKVQLNDDYLPGGHVNATIKNKFSISKTK